MGQRIGRSGIMTEAEMMGGKAAQVFLEQTYHENREMQEEVRRLHAWHIRRPWPGMQGILEGRAGAGDGNRTGESYG